MRFFPAALAGLALAVGAGGLSLVTHFEGTELRTYRDSGGVPTVCTGHTGPEVRMGQLYTPEQCRAFLAKDLRTARLGVASCVKVPLSQNQADALTSFAFNVGVPKFCRSTMARKLSIQDYRGAAEEFPKWKYVRANGRNVVLAGLERRRLAEQRLFRTP